MDRLCQRQKALRTPQPDPVRLIPASSSVFPGLSRNAKERRLNSCVLAAWRRRCEGRRDLAVAHSSGKILREKKASSG
jgi:hypothetical protein